jgi:hypothetical protein
MKEGRYRVFKKKMLRRISLLTKDGGNVHNEKLHNLYTSPKIIQVGEMGGVGSRLMHGRDDCTYKICEHSNEPLGNFWSSTANTSLCLMKFII